MGSLGHNKRKVDNMESEDGRGEGQESSPPHLRPHGDFSEPGSFGLVAEADAEFIRMNALAHLTSWGCAARG